MTSTLYAQKSINHDVNDGLPPEAHGCDLIFCDPPYHTMLARRYAADGVANAPLAAWIDFLDRLARDLLRRPPPRRVTSPSCSPTRPRKTSRPASAISITPFMAINALTAAGFLPERRVSCPMDGAYLPQHVQRARADGRMLGQVRDLLVMRKPGETDTLRQAARRRPARRPCPGRRGWRGSGCGGRSARGATPRPGGPGLRSSSGRRLLDHQVDRRLLLGLRRFLPLALPFSGDRA